MFNFVDLTKENIKEHNSYWPQISDHSYRILIIGGSESGKTKSLFKLISQHHDIDEIHLYAKDPYNTKYQLLINKRGSKELKHLNDSKAFIEYSNDLDNVHEIYNLNTKRKILTVFDHMIPDVLSYRKLNPIVNELFISEVEN